MKKIGLYLFSAVLLMGLCSSLQQSPIKESVLDEEQGLSAVSLRNIQIGTQENVKVSPTYVQVGKRMSTNNYVLRFATAISGPVSSATYSRTAIGLEDKTKSVTTVYRGISGNDVTYYYNGSEIVTEESELTKDYYWACFVVEYQTTEFVETDFNVSLTVNSLDGTNLVSTPKVTSLNAKLDEEEGIYRINLKGMTFKDGSTYKYLEEGESLEGLFEAPTVEGYTYKGVCEVGKVSKLIALNKMPSRDLTLAPVYDRSYAETNKTISSENLGKINVGTFHSVWSATQLVSSKASNSYDSAFYNEKTGVYELLRNYKYREGVEANSLFIGFNSSITSAIVDGTAVTYTVQNQGEETVQLKIAQTKSSGTPDGNYPNGVITLEPGEIKEVDITLINHNSFMTMVKILNKLEKPFNIAMMCESAISKVTLGQMKFKDGTSQKYLYTSTDLAQHLYESVEEYKLKGYLVEGSSSLKTSYVVPVEDMDIRPVYDVEAYSTYIASDVKGKVSLNNLHPNAGIVGFTRSELNTDIVTTLFNKDLGIYEYARSYKKASGVNEGDSILTYHEAPKDGTDVVNGTYYLIQKTGIVMTFTLENRSTEAIEFTINQAKSSGNPQGDSQCMQYVQTVKLEAGEVKDVNLTLVRYNSLMVYFKMLKSTTSPFNLVATLKHNI